LTASGPKPEVKLQAALAAADTVADAAIKGYRPVYFTELNAAVATPIYDRARLPVGVTFTGPAIVEEKDSTAVIGPRSTVSVDAFANLIVTLMWQDDKTTR
jgi:N-methylhydantoinase A